MNYQYDYIIAGTGCAGLSLAVALFDAGLTKGKKILLIDREQKIKNDRTWCFWEKEDGRFDEIVFRKWDAVNFHGLDYSECLNLTPYSYKMIRGIDFYEYCLNVLNTDESFETIYSPILAIKNEKDHAVVQTENDIFTAKYIFSSIPPEKLDSKKTDYHLLQHFKGYFVKTKNNVFNEALPTLMDFRIPQEFGTSFIYTMPFSKNEALVEYTVFSDALLQDELYDLQLQSYMNEIANEDWEIVEEEFGVIPMTNHRFKRRDGNILQIGFMGGMTKPSSGYTFTFIQNDTKKIISSIQQHGNPFEMEKPSAGFLWYDSVLLNVLSEGKPSGATVFSSLFKNNKPQDIFEFLDNQTAFGKELSIISTLPQIPFMIAGVQEFWKKITV